jgi:hypothetical protein
MSEFVLVAGAWLGSWAWDEVVPELRAAGHGTHPLTLSGLADKQSVPAGQQTHVQDIVSEVERLGLRDVVLGRDARPPGTGGTAPDAGVAGYTFHGGVGRRCPAGVRQPIRAAERRPLLLSWT